MRKTKIAIISIMIAVIVLLSLVLFYYSLPSVIYVESNTLSEVGIKKPSLFSISYRIRYIREDELVPELEAELVILDPFVSDVDLNAKSARWGRRDDLADINYVVSDVDLWSLISGDVAFIYPEYNPIAFDILEKNPEFTGIKYSGRISNVNRDEIKAKLEGFSAIALFEPESALSLLYTGVDCDVYVDFRDYPAFKDRKNVKAILPDWDSAIKSALKLDSGDISFDYTL